MYNIKGFEAFCGPFNTKLPPNGFACICRAFLSVDPQSRSSIPVFIMTFKPFFLLILSLSSIAPAGCASTEPAPTAGGPKNGSSSETASPAVSNSAPSLRSAIAIEPNSPADVVRTFYKYLREHKFRDAIFLTNLRPAIEGLTDSELREFQVDFERIANAVPEEVVISGQVISGNRATVMANLPGEDPEKTEVQKIELRKDGDVWIILSVDEAAEARIRKEGKNYFRVLRIETHEDEARDMLDRISRAEFAYALQKGGEFADIETLIAAGLLPEDIRTAESTGYNYSLLLSESKREFTALATPAEYGRSGKLSFLLYSDGKKTPQIVSKDNGGKPLSR